ncbi:hypothetical protein COO60DRAFT_1643776 [Scenedesmus sp. NREL 46B-D3]|nr:hypothetical protein COO60DRAFT_1643776 [Scenedesmus sp. NREL 46B-D3]
MQARILLALAEDAMLKRVAPPQRRCETLCHRIEQLGPAAIKLGQLMATTPGLIADPALQAQLSSRLHDRVRPRPISELLTPPQLAELVMLKGIDAEPLGSASIAQVHKAHMLGASAAPAALKVVRPNAARSIRSSFGALEGTLRFVQRWLPSASDAGAMHHTKLLLRDACAMLEAEVDMAAEFDNMQLCYELAAATSSPVAVPRPLGHCLGGRALVMEYIDAKPLATAQLGLDAGQRRRLAQDIAAWWLEGIVRHRVVHGDPHVGNWGMASDTGQLVLFDYGNIVQLSPAELQGLLRLVEALAGIVTRVPIGQAYLKRRAEQLGPECGVHILDWATFEADVSSIVRYLTAPGIVKLDNDGLKARRKVAARLSGPALRLVRSLLLVDGVCRGLDPQFAWGKAF